MMRDFASAAAFGRRLLTSSSFWIVLASLGVIAAPRDVAAQVWINAGGPAVTDSGGQAWAADKNFSGGATYSKSVAIAGTVDDALFQTERYGNFSYNIPVPNGTYAITLRFAEIYWTSAGKRVFNVTVEGQPALTNFDIFAAAGANTAVDRVVNATVTDGTLNIGFVTVVDNAKVSAIKVAALTGVNQPPVVNAGLDRAITLPTNSVALTGTASDDGLPAPPAALTYAWSLVTGPAAPTFTAATALTTTATFPVAGTYTLRLTASDSALSTSDDLVITVNPAGVFAPVRINTGGPAITDSGGQAWAADKNFSGGATYSKTVAIAGTVDDALFQTERYGNFSYNIPVPNGTYAITLRFAEIYWTSAGKRVFNVTVEGQPALTNFDIFAAAGANTAVDRVVNATVTDGTLNIGFVTMVDNAKVSAIQVAAAAPPPAPVITTVAPLVGAPGTAVTITGTNFGTTQSTSTLTFNGVAALPTSWSATTITAPVPAGAATGNIVVTVGGQASNGVSFTVPPPPPMITTVAPLAGAPGTAVTITGTNFGTTQSTSTVTFNGTAALPTSWSATTIVVPVPAAATTGNVVVAVGGQASNGVSFTVSPLTPAPTITAVTPLTGAPGTVVTITGADFGTTQSTSAVTFNGTAALPTSWSATTIVVPVPAAATTGNIVVTVGGQASNGVNFTVPVPAPTITTVAPLVGAPGTPVTITGTDFGTTQSTSSVTFNGTAGLPTSWSATTIVVPVPAAATTGNVVVTVGAQPSNGVSFAVSPPAPPAITSVAPLVGAPGTSITITGTDFGTTQSTSSVTFNGTAGLPTTWGATTIVVPVPAGATTGNVVVTVDGQASNGVSFTVPPAPPAITTVAPLVGAPGTSVTITGTDFGTTQSTSTVTFNGTSALPASWSATTIVVPVPAGATTGKLVVTVSGQASNGVSFTVPPPPAITTVAPFVGAPGTAVTITGTNFGTTQSTSTVTFNGTSALPASWSATTIVVPVPAAATTGNVVVTVNGQSSNGVSFGVVGAGPVITSLTPASGLEGTAVTITGSDFGTNLQSGEIGWWGPFQPGVTPTNHIAGEPDGAFVGTPTFSGDGGGAITSTDANYLDIVDGGAGGPYDWTSGPWSVQVDFAFPATPTWPSLNSFVLVSTGSFSQGTGWEIEINNQTYQGKYQIELISNHGVGSYNLVTAYQVVPGAFHRALVVCDGAGHGMWYVNGAPWTSMACAAPASATTDLLIGRDSAWTGEAAGFPIARVQIWNRALTAAEAVVSTTTDPTADAGVVTFAGTIATPTSWTPTSIVAPVPSGASSGPIVVTVGTHASNGVNFSVTPPPPPRITGLSPSSGLVGSAVTVTGTNFGLTRGTSTIAFNGTLATPTSWSDTSIVVPVPAGASTGPVVVTVRGQDSNGVSYTVIVPPPPTLTSLSPTSGSVGTTLTITGTNFGTTAQASSVTFNGAAATAKSWSATTIVVPVPVGATSGNVVVTVGGVASNGLNFTVANQDVLTYHNDAARTGQNLKETILTPANVRSNTFGRLFTILVDGKVDAQPLYASQVSVSGKGVHNLLIVATEHDTVYAFDADTGTRLWSVSTLKLGETTSDARGCDQVSPEIGITSTPVIDRTRGPNGVIYLVAMSKDGSGNYFQRIHALDLASGAELPGSPADIQAVYPGLGDNSIDGMVTFDPGQYKERAALVLANGVIFTSWASHCDFSPYTGWVIGYDAATLAQRAVLNLVPNGRDGAIWMSGAGPAADGAGNLYILDGNGDFDATLDASGFPSRGDYGNAFLKLSTSGGLAVADYFEMHDQQAENLADIDLGSGGALVLPDLTDGSGNVWRLVVGAGKDSNIYVLNRDAMGRFNASGNDIYQELAGALPNGIWSMPAYFNGRLYFGSVGLPIYAFQFSNAKLSDAPVSQSSNTFSYPGATPSISASDSANGIVWASENTSPAVLHAYDATDLQEIYNSEQASAGRDRFGDGNKFITPTVVNGKVYVATTTGIGVFGLLQP